MANGVRSNERRGLIQAANATLWSQLVLPRRLWPLSIGTQQFEHSDESPVGGVTKRCLDVAIAVVALILLSPILIVVACLVRLTSEGPIIYAHRRIGFNGEVFNCYKFRTMVLNGDAVLRQHLASNSQAALEWAGTRKLVHDPRVTSIGRILRMSSLDELPQFLNVIQGNMSCVGPRPVVTDELERYGKYAADYTKSRPGITGLWQVSGRNTRTYQERVMLDHFYVRRWSLFLDLVILLKTVPCVLRFDQTS